MNEENINKLITNALVIEAEAPTNEAIGYMHAVLSQVGLPRKKTEGFMFERTSGGASLLVEAGKLWNGREWLQQPLPYGPKPRVMLMDLFTYAIKHQTRVIDLGDSITDYLRRLGWTKQGGAKGPLTMFHKQAQALAACHMSLGVAYGNQAHTVSGQPIRRFAAWLDDRGRQRTMWPAALELSADFWESLREFAVPLDMRSVRALSGSALALDLYTWLAHRLHRLKKPVFVPWKPLREQFGQEYKDPKEFRKATLMQLHKVLAVYPNAKVEQVKGGLLLRQSPPPIPKIQISVPRLTE